MPGTGVEVLHRGLPPLPEQLTYQLSIPVAYWTTSLRGVVLFLGFSWWDDDKRWFPKVTMATFTRDGNGWSPTRHWMFTGWSHDPIANPGSFRDLGGRAMATGGGSETITHGRVAPAVREIGVIQNGHENRRPLESHFGAWVVCTDEPLPFRVAAYNKSGVMLADTEGP